MTALRPRPAAVLLAAALLAGGCSVGAPVRSGKAPSAPSTDAASTGSASSVGGRYRRYVAMGDSFSAGPLIPTTDLAGGCARSDRNYPSLVARRLDVTRFVDVTCSAATTRDLTGVQPSFGDTRIPPQVRALTPGTDLVTIGIGGNDLDLFSTLVRTCTRLRASDPTGSPCARRLAVRGTDIGAVARSIGGNVAASLRMIRARAPQATIVLVGYLRLVPDTGTCRALPLATGDYAVGRRISTSLNHALKRAARASRVRFVDMYDASRDHDICSTRPWVNGNVTDRQRALAYHPLAAGMRADAERVLAALGR